MFLMEDNACTKLVAKILSFALQEPVLHMKDQDVFECRLIVIIFVELHNVPCFMW